MKGSFNMFDVENTELIKKFIDLREYNKNSIVLPIYVLIGNVPYGLTELNSIETCTQSMIKVVFGSSNNVFRSYGFPATDLIKLNNVKKFSYYDEDKQVMTDYVYFESSGVDEPSNPLDENINMWYDLISDKIMKIVESKRKERIKKLMEEDE